MIMIKFSRQAVVAVGIVVLVAALCASASFAGDFHNKPENTLRCSSCHVMHASKNSSHTTGSAAAVYNGALPNPSGWGTNLITKVSINNVCCGCHNSSTSAKTDPVVIAPGTAAAPSSNVAGGQYNADPYGASAGFFQTDALDATLTTGIGVANPCAHDLGVAGEAVPCSSGTWTTGAMGMTCVDCHDPHSNSNWFNLSLRPGNAATDLNVTAGTTGTQDVYFNAPIVTVGKTSADITAHYKSSNMAFNNGGAIVSWCAGCHDSIQTGSKHPQNVAVSTLPDSGANWTAAGDSGTGFGTTVDDGTPGIPRVRFAQAGSSYADCRTNGVGTDNKVFCLTCHKAHGSKYDSNLVTPYYTSGNADQNSACAQCHDKGV